MAFLLATFVATSFVAPSTLGPVHAARCTEPVSTLAATRPALRAPYADMLLTETSAGLLAATGALAWVSPQTNLPGFKNYDESAQVIVRAVGAFQMCLASVLIAGTRGVAVAAGHGLYSAALTILAVVPVWEHFDRPKGPQVGVAILFAALGKLCLRGKASPLLAPAAYLLTGVLIYFTPKATAELYQASKPISELGYSMLSLYGGVISMSGVYLASLTYGLTQPQSLAAVFVTNALLSLKWVVAEAGKLEAPKAGALLWAAISALLAVLALK